MELSFKYYSLLWFRFFSTVTSLKTNEVTWLIPKASAYVENIFLLCCYKSHLGNRFSANRSGTRSSITWTLPRIRWIGHVFFKFPTSLPKSGVWRFPIWIICKIYLLTLFGHRGSCLITSGNNQERFTSSPMLGSF